MEKKYRVIFHIDLNAFFASCEIAEDPSLKEKPIAIGGNSDRGVLTTANYVARKFGVKSAMSNVEARRLCPQLTILPVNFPLYQKYSNIFFDVLAEYSEEVEKGSIDEGYLDLTLMSDEVHPMEIAKEIQSRLLNDHKLPISIGIAPNMFLAKMASDMKKPLGITILRKRDVKQKLWPLPIEDMYGIGSKTYPNLKLLGIHTIGDLVSYKDERKLTIVLGTRYKDFIDKANGIDDKQVDAYRHADMKSIGTSQTYQEDLFDYQEILEKFVLLTRKVTNRMIKDESICKTISIQVKYSDFKVINRSKTLDIYTDNYYEIYQIVEKLYDDNQGEKTIRLLGVSLSNLISNVNNFRQINIFDIPKEETQGETVQKMVNLINKAYGVSIITKGVSKAHKNAGKSQKH